LAAIVRQSAIYCLTALIAAKVLKAARDHTNKGAQELLYSSQPIES